MQRGPTELMKKEHGLRVESTDSMRTPLLWLGNEVLIPSPLTPPSTRKEPHQKGVMASNDASKPHSISPRIALLHPSTMNYKDKLFQTPQGSFHSHMDIHRNPPPSFPLRLLLALQNFGVSVCFLSPTYIQPITKLSPGLRFHSILSCWWDLTHVIDPTWAMESTIMQPTLHMVGTPNCLVKLRSIFSTIKETNMISLYEDCTTKMNHFVY